MAAWLRWDKPPRPTEGDERVVSRFLFLPTRFGREVRWLGFELRAQRYEAWVEYVPEIGPCDVVGWRNKGWIGAETE